MSEILQYLKLPHVVEVDKAYPKDWLFPGRVKVLIKNENGFYPNLTIKSSILKKIK